VKVFSPCSGNLIVDFAIISTMEQVQPPYRIKVTHIKDEVEDFKIFIFAEEHSIHYKAGQYLTLITNNGNEEVRRSYSITSSPQLNDPLSIGVKRIKNGFFSRLLFDTIKTGDAVTTTGSGGLFVLPADINVYKQCFFFAAGSGITPIFSLIKTILHTHHHLSVVLIYSNTSIETTIFLNEIIQLQQQFEKRFIVEFLFSTTTNLYKARLHRNLIFEFLDKYAYRNKNEILFYTCGPENYMRLCVFTLRETGIASSNIKRENFVVHTVSQKNVFPPDKNTYNIELNVGLQIYKFQVHYPDTILRAAKKAGISLPYSCEAGSCGNCVAKLKKGKVWHSANEVLTDKEIEKGLALTCVGHPVGGDVKLEI
jgi:ferredoxin-NADP reductase